MTYCRNVYTIAQGSDPEFLIPAKEDAHDDD